MFSFAIRDLSWLTLAVAMGLGWQAERSEHAKLAAEHTRLRGAVLWCPPEMQVVFDEYGDFHLEGKPER
jgi:hypothetical protein